LKEERIKFSTSIKNGIQEEEKVKKKILKIKN